MKQETVIMSGGLPELTIRSVSMQPEKDLTPRGLPYR